MTGDTDRDETDSDSDARDLTACVRCKPLTSKFTNNVMKTQR